jgi:hypothetical protein
MPARQGDMASHNPTSFATALRLAASPEFRTNARIYASDAMIDLLTGVATEHRVAVVVDIDGFERGGATRIDRVMRMALDALCHVSVDVVLLVRDQRERAAALRAELARSWCCERGDPTWTLARLHERLPGVPLITISDDLDLLEHLSGRDRGIAIGPSCSAARGNIAPSGHLNVRAALWWIVDARWKAGLVAWT